MKISRNVYNLIISCLQELSDLNFQERVWLRGEGPEESSYTEIVCQLFDDAGLGDLLGGDHPEVILSEKIDSLLKVLMDQTDRIDSNDEVTNIIRHKDWPDVTRVAAEALTLLKECASSPDESYIASGQEGDEEGASLKK